MSNNYKIDIRINDLNNDLDLFPIDNSLTIKSMKKQTQYLESNNELTLNKKDYEQNIKRYTKEKRKESLRNYYNKHKEYYKKLHRENYLKNKSKILKRLKKNNEVRSK